MSTKRSISVRKIIQTAVTAVLLGLCVFVMLSASRIQDQQHLKGLKIAINNESDCRFIDKEQVTEMILTQRHINMNKLAVGAVDVLKMEHILAANPWIESAQVYVDAKRQLNVSVVQRIPEIRVFERNGDSYYIDESKHLLPLSDHYTHYGLIFVQVPELNGDSLRDIMYSNMLYVAHFIKRSEFWTAQTAQIIVNGIDDFELIPVLGNQRILLGDTADLKQKFDNLFAFYRHVENKIGWDRYEILDARFRNQIVASPSLPWKAPVDRALTNMNWVKSIIGNTDVKEEASAFPMGSAAAAPAATVAAPKPVVPKPAVTKPAAGKPVTAKPAARH